MAEPSGDQLPSPPSPSGNSFVAPEPGSAKTKRGDPLRSTDSPDGDHTMPVQYPGTSMRGAVPSQLTTTAPAVSEMPSSDMYGFFATAPTTIRQPSGDQVAI